MELTEVQAVVDNMLNATSAVVGTGGGCQAVQAVWGDWEILVTDGDAGVDFSDYFVVGTYNSEGDNQHYVEKRCPAGISERELRFALIKLIYLATGRETG
jgi:hypothetical protein